MMKKKVLLLIAVMIFLVIPLQVFAATFFEDEFTRADSNTVGNNWTETETAATDLRTDTNQMISFRSSANLDVVKDTGFTQAINGDYLNVTARIYINSSGRTNIRFYLRDPGDGISTGCAAWLPWDSLDFKTMENDGDGVTDTGYNFAADSWAEVSVVHDYSADTYMICLNGQCNTPRSSVGICDSAKFVSLQNNDKASGVFKVDYVYAYDASGPTPPPGNFELNLTDKWAGNNLTNGSVEVAGIGNFTTTSGRIFTNFSYLTHPTINLTIASNDSGGYYSRSIIGHDVTKNLVIPMWQHVLNITAKNSASDTAISSFSVGVDNNRTYATAEGNVTLLMRDGSYQVNVSGSSFNHTVLTIDAEPLQTEQVEVYLNPIVQFNLLREKNGENFNVSGTTSTDLLVFCPGDTLQYSFSNYTLFQEITCDFEFMRIDVDYTSSSYFRTLKPDSSETNITFYTLDLTEDLAYQINLELNDLTGQFTDGYAILEKVVAGKTVSIIEQDFDVESKVTLYLLKDGLYTLKIVSSAGVERNLGYFVADAAETKTITIPAIDFVPDEVIGDSLSWMWSSTKNYIRLIYNDTATTTTELNFIIYNGSSINSVLYQTSSSNVGTVTNTYNHANMSYLACFNASVTGTGLIGECRVYDFEQNLALANATGFSAADETNLKSWFAVIIIFIALIAGEFLFSGIGISMAMIFAWAFMKWEWFTLGNAYLDYGFLSIGAMIAIMTLWWQVNKQ